MIWRRNPDMMISPEGYIEQHKDAEYLDLIKERNELILKLSLQKTRQGR